MKKVDINILSLLFLLVLSSCSKDGDLNDPLPGPQPVFHVNAFLEGQEISINAGQEEFFMFTKYDQDSLEVYSFTGQFGKLINCTEQCEEALSITIRDTQESLDSLSILNPFRLRPDFYNYLQEGVAAPGPVQYEVILTDESDYQGDPAISSWLLKGNAIGMLVPEIRDTVLELDKEYLLSLEVGGGACTSTYVQVVSSDHENDCFNECDFVIEEGAGDGYTISTTSSNPNASNWVYQWNGSGFSDTLTIDDDGTYCLTITNADGCSTERCICISNLNPDISTVVFSSAAFSYEVLPIEGEGLFNPFGSSEVIITYTNKEGIEFRSDLQQQHPLSSFSILNIENYELDENGIPTLRLDIEFNCLLFNDNGDSFNLENGVASVGVAFPFQ